MTCRYDGPGSVVAEVNGKMLYRAFENILRNAADGTEVLIQTRLESSPHFVVSGKHHGPGVPHEELGRIFEPFGRHTTGHPHAKPTNGSGLGLAITRNAVLIHGGTILARRAHPQGLIIRLRLPISV